MYTCRYLTEKQRALVTALAELDGDLQGTVNGVSEKNKTNGKIPIRQNHLHVLSFIMQDFASTAFRIKFFIYTDYWGTYNDIMTNFVNHTGGCFFQQTTVKMDRNFE